MAADSEEEASRGKCEAEPQEAALPAEEFISGQAEQEAREKSEVELLQQELALLETQLQHMRDRYIRAVADLDNARKRARQAIVEARAQAVAGVLLDLLGLVDNFERALETARPGPRAPAKLRAVHEGVALIYRQLLDILERRGVRPIAAVGEPFNPSRHEAVAQIPATEDQKEGTVALEVQKGYMLADHVLRPSKVGVVVHDADKRRKDGEQ